MVQAVATQMDDELHLAPPVVEQRHVELQKADEPDFNKIVAGDEFDVTAPYFRHARVVSKKGKRCIVDAWAEQGPRIPKKGEKVVKVEWQELWGLLEVDEEAYVEDVLKQSSRQLIRDPDEQKKVVYLAVLQESRPQGELRKQSPLLDDTRKVYSRVVAVKTKSAVEEVEPKRKAT